MVWFQTNTFRKKIQGTSSSPKKVKKPLFTCRQTLRKAEGRSASVCSVLAIFHVSIVIYVMKIKTFFWTGRSSLDFFSKRISEPSLNLLIELMTKLVDFGTDKTTFVVRPITSDLAVVLMGPGFKTDLGHVPYQPHPSLSIPSLSCQNLH